MEPNDEVVERQKLVNDVETEEEAQSAPKSATPASPAVPNVRYPGILLRKPLFILVSCRSKSKAYPAARPLAAETRPPAPSRGRYPKRRRTRARARVKRPPRWPMWMSAGHARRRTAAVAGVPATKDSSSRPGRANSWKVGAAKKSTNPSLLPFSRCGSRFLVSAGKASVLEIT